jgi:alpha-beta hydrolase superfamily lysophospholipase
MLDTTSFPAFVRSLKIAGPVTARGGRMVAGPPRPLAELGLRLGLGALFVDTPKTRSILANLGIDPALSATLARRMRSFSMWRGIWEDLAAPHLKAVEAAIARGDREAAIKAIRTTLTMLDVAYGGDNYYVFTPLPQQRKIIPICQRLYAQLRDLTGDPVERITVAHARGATTGLLHLPKSGAPPYPALLGLHPLSGNKDAFDVALAPFRQARYATFCIDLPAHGENFDGPRLHADDEHVALAALEALAARPEIDARRLAVLGASMGGFFALRTAARDTTASRRVKACLAFASAFDIGSGIPVSVRGIRENFAYVIGAGTFDEVVALSAPFHLRDVIGSIACPIALVHGTQDHICDFTVTYEVVRRAKAPVTVFPLVGADHEAAIPSAPHIAGPGIEWLRKIL